MSDEPVPAEPIAVAEAEAALLSTGESPLGELGRPYQWRRPFFVGLAAAAGVAVTVGGLWLVFSAGHILVLTGLSLFLAIGIDPGVAWLVRHRVPRWLAVIVMVLGIVALIGGTLAAAIPAAITQIEQLSAHLPQLMQQLSDRSTLLGRLDSKFHLQQYLQSLLQGTTGSVSVPEVLSLGTRIVSALADVLVVLVLTVYFVADLPRVRRFLYRFVPASRRPRALLLGDSILHKVGVYMLGNLLISVISGLLTLVWLLVFAVPYALLLALLVALLDLIPVVGSTVAAVLVAAVSLTVSLPICIATVAFFIFYRLAEDYLLIPRVIGRAVDVPGLITVIAVITGGALLGIVGALVAIPVAAAVLLVLREIVFPRLDRR